MTTRVETYERFVIHQLLPAPPGWRVLYSVEDAAPPFYEAPLTLFALVTRRRYRCLPWNDRLPEDGGWEEDECREIVGVEYGVADGFWLVDEMSSYVCLLPPDVSLTDYLAQHLSPLAASPGPPPQEG